MTNNEDSNISQVNIYVRMIDFSKRKNNTIFQSMKEARRVLRRYKLFRTAVQVSSGVGSSSEDDFSFSIQGNDLDVSLQSIAKPDEKVLKDEGLCRSGYRPGNGLS